MLTEILADAACHDQLNLGGNLFFETVTRRMSTITETLPRPTPANWSQAHEIIGRSRADSLLSLERRAEVSRPLRTRSAGHPSRVVVSTEDVYDAVAFVGHLGISEISPAGRVRAGVPRLLRGHSSHKPQYCWRWKVSVMADQAGLTFVSRATWAL